MDARHREKHCQPVCLLLIDINMQNLNGFETLQAVKELFDKHNSKAQQESEHSTGAPISHFLALRPLICFYS